VKVIGQHDHRVDREGMPPSRFVERGPQFSDVIREQPQPPIHEIDGEEEAASGDEVAAIAGHAASSRRGVMGIASLNPSYKLP
jgi:hypothetical protein